MWYFGHGIQPSQENFVCLGCNRIVGKIQKKCCCQNSTIFAVLKSAGSDGTYVLWHISAGFQGWEIDQGKTKWYELVPIRSFNNNICFNTVWVLVPPKQPPPPSSLVTITTAEKEYIDFFPSSRIYKSKAIDKNVTSGWGVL